MQLIASQMPSGEMSVGITTKDFNLNLGKLFRKKLL